jgi:hypothetical protein
MRIKRIVFLVGILFLSFIIFYLTKLHKDNVVPFLNYKSSVDSLVLTNGSSLFYFATLDTMTNRDTMSIAVYGRLPILIIDKKKYDTFEKAHIKRIKLPKNIKYIKFNDKLISLESIKEQSQY